MGIPHNVCINSILKDLTLQVQIYCLEIIYFEDFRDLEVALKFDNTYSEYNFLITLKSDN